MVGRRAALAESDEIIWVQLQVRSEMEGDAVVDFHLPGPPADGAGGMVCQEAGPHRRPLSGAFLAPLRLPLKGILYPLDNS